MPKSHNTKIKPLPPEKYTLGSLSWVSCVADSRIIPMSCDKISAFNYSGPIWGFQGHWGEAATTSSLQPLEEPSSAQIASRPPLKTNWSAQTHTHRREGGFGKDLWHILWLKGRRVHLIFGDGWYLWQVILEGGSPLLHRSPPLPCLMDITRCPASEFAILILVFSTSVKVDTILTPWHHSPSNHSF